MSFPIHSYWQGKVHSGTNRGIIYASLRFNNDQLFSNVIFYDYQLGPALISASGKLSGLTTELQMSSFKQMGIIPGVICPLVGKYDLSFDNEYRKATGTWQTDVGTQGQFDFIRIQTSLFFWCYISILVRGQWLWQQLLRLGRFLVAVIMEFVTFVYAVGLFIALPGAALYYHINLSPWILILLILPTPFIFRKQLDQFILFLRASGIKSIPGIAFGESQAPNVEAKTNCISTGNEVYDTLNRVFALKTKIMLLEVYLKEGLPESEFIRLCNRLDLTNTQTNATKDILIEKGCLHIVDKIFQITKTGEGYLRDGVRFP